MRAASPGAASLRLVIANRRLDRDAIPELRDAAELAVAVKCYRP